MKHLYFKYLSLVLSLLLVPSVLMALEKDGEVYVIGTSDELIEFAQLVNSGKAYNIYGNADAKLIADIDLRGRESEFPLIGTAAHQFMGTFDGQLHTITYNLVSTAESCGLFAYSCGTVRNLYVDGTMQVNHDSAGSIVGTANFPALIEQCHSKVKITVNNANKVGGLVGLSSGSYTPPYVQIQNCIYSGHIMGFSFQYSGILGLAEDNTVVKNCLVTAQIDTDVTQGTGHIIAGETPDNAWISNCYYVYPYGNPIPRGATQITMDQVESGEVCCLLNFEGYYYGGVSHLTTFRQNIGEDKFPVFDSSHGIVKEITSIGVASFAPGYFEFCSESRGNVTVPEGVKAYTGTVSGNSLLLRPAGNVIGGGNGHGFVLKGEPGFYSFMPTHEEVVAVDNDLHGGNGVFTTQYANYYVLKEKDGVVGFYELGNSEGIDSHIAYLINPPTNVEMLPLVFEEETAIQEVQHAQKADDTFICDLSGRRVKNATKGVYIVNGKKIVRGN